MKKRLILLAEIAVVAVLIFSAIVYINIRIDNNTAGIQYTPGRPEAWNENLTDRAGSLEREFNGQAGSLEREFDGQAGSLGREFTGQGWKFGTRI